MSHPTATPAIPIPYDALSAFCQRHRVRKLMLFGSVLRDGRGTPRPYISPFDNIMLANAVTINAAPRI
jgi:hypothetical protein